MQYNPAIDVTLSEDSIKYWNIRKMSGSFPIFEACWICKNVKQYHFSIQYFAQGVRNIF